MIKGHSYDEQIYYSVVDRLINNTFLNKTNGIFNGVGNSCQLNNTSNSITISNGFFIVQGGVTEIVDSETISVILDNSYCSLVYEIDMSRENTDTTFTQGQFKIITGQNSYPTLTQQILQENNGIYQYEFARFRAYTTGIANFQDRRTFVDYESIFSYIQDQINSIEDGSAYVLKEDFNDLKENVDELNEAPIIKVQDTEPSRIVGKTIVWIKPKE